MDDVINDRRYEIYSKMKPEIHDLVTREKFINQWGALYDEVGKPSAYSLASQGVGIRTISAGPHVGQTKPTAEIIYNVTTTKGVYPFKIKVVDSEGHLAVTYASFVLPN